MLQVLRLFNCGSLVEEAEEDSIVFRDDGFLIEGLLSLKH